MSSSCYAWAFGRVALAGDGAQMRPLIAPERQVEALVWEPGKGSSQPGLYEHSASEQVIGLFVVSVSLRNMGIIIINLEGREPYLEKPSTI